MTDITSAIYAELPGYTDTVDRLTSLRRMTPPSTQGAVSVVDQVAHDLISALDGDDAPAALIASARTAVVEIEAIRVAREAITEATTRLTEQRNQIITQGAETILAGLNTALNDVVAEVTNLRPLDQIATELAAYQADRRGDYDALAGLLAKYAAIRTAQNRIVTDELGSIDQDDATIRAALYITNLPEVFPLWRPWLTHGFLVSERAGQTRPLLPPWPVPADDGMQQRRGDGTQSRATIHRDATAPAFLIWAVEAGARLWVPTMAQFSDTAADLTNQLHSEDRPLQPNNDDWLDPAVMARGAVRISGARQRMTQAN